MRGRAAFHVTGAAAKEPFPAFPVPAHVLTERSPFQCLIQPLRVKGLVPQIAIGLYVDDIVMIHENDRMARTAADEAVDDRPLAIIVGYVDEAAGDAIEMRKELLQVQFHLSFFRRIRLAVNMNHIL